VKACLQYRYIGSEERLEKHTVGRQVYDGAARQMVNPAQAAAKLGCANLNLPAPQCMDPCMSLKMKLDIP